MSYQRDKHDIGLKRADASTIGLMLVQDKAGTPQYAVDDDEFLAAQMFTGVPGYGNLPPEKELAIRQAGFRSGFGLEVWNDDEPERYYKSINADLRHRGMAIAGPKATAVTMPFTPDLALTNATMEAGTVAAEAVGENYDTGDLGILFWGAIWKAQTFTPPVDITLTKVSLKLYRVGSPGTITVSIRATSASKPTGADLTSGTTNGDTLTDVTTGEWRDIDLTDYALSPGTVYAIVVRAAAAPDSNNGGYWKYEATGAYANGNAAASSDSGSTWATGAEDYRFKVYGTRTTVDNWTGGNRSTEQVVGTYSLWVYNTNSYQDMSWVAGYASQYFKVTMAVYCGVASTARIGISNKAGDTPTYSSYHSGTPGWETLTVRKILASDATRLRVLCYSDTAADAFFDTALLVDPSSGPVAFGEFNGVQYGAVGDLLVYLNSTGTAFTALKNFDAEIADIEAFGDGKLYISLGFTKESRLYATITDVATSMAVIAGDGASYPTPNFYLRIEEEIVLVTVKSTDTFTITRAQLGTTGVAHTAGVKVFDTYKYWYMSAAETFTESDSCAEFFCAVGATMWKVQMPRSIYSATVPTTDAGWSGATLVDSSTYNILELITDGTTLVIKKKDRVFYYSSTSPYIFILVGQTKHLVGDTSTKRSACEWQKKYYFGYGSQSLVEYDGGTITWRSPAKYCTNLSEYVGEVQALAGDEEYLFVVVDYATKVEILAGRSETIDGTTSWVGHPISEITLAGCEIAFVSTVYKKRLWIASTSSSDSLYYIPLTTKYGDILNDSDYTFQTGGEIWTPYLHGNFRGDPKAWIKLILEMAHTYNVGRYFTVSYQEFGGSWVSIGNYTGSATSMIQSRFIDVTNKPDEVMIRFKFVPVTDDTAITPVLKSYDCRAILYPSRRRIIRAIIRCADGITDKMGSPLEADAATIKAALEEAADTTASHWPVEFYDIYGTTKNIRLLATPEFIRVTRQEEGKNPELQIRIIAQEVALA